MDKSKHSTQEIDAFNKYWNEIERPKGSILVYNTARCIKMYTKLVEANPNMMPPDVLITGEGTEIRWLVEDDRMRDSFGHDGVRFVPDAEWSQKIHSQWWTNGLRGKVLATLDPLDCGKIQYLNHVSNSPPHGEARHAVAVDDLTAAEAEELASDIATALGNDQVKLFHVNGWVDDTEVLTAVPICAGKDGASKYVANKLLFEHQHVLAAGDTKGDVSMVEGTDFAFICVGNGTDGLKHSCLHRKVAVRGDYMSPFSGAGGVIDGLLGFVEEH